MTRRRKAGRRSAAAAAPPEENQTQVGNTRVTDIERLVEAIRLTATSLAGIAMRVGPLRGEDDNKRIPALVDQGFTRKETAGILGTTIDTVRARMSDAARARKRKRRGKR